MDDNSPSTLSARLRRILFQLAKEQDELAAREAAAVPYWRPYAGTVLAHRAAAAALRDRADLVGTAPNRSSP